MRIPPLDQLHNRRYKSDLNYLALNSYFFRILLAGYDGMFGYALNNRGAVVGAATRFAGGNFRAFLYDDGQLLDLNSVVDPALGLDFLSANGINDLGQIVANTDSRAHLLTPALTTVPEPGSAVLLPIALAGLFALNRHRFRDSNHAQTQLQLTFTLHHQTRSHSQLGHD